MERENEHQEKCETIREIKNITHQIQHGVKTTFCTLISRCGKFVAMRRTQCAKRGITAMLNDDASFRLCTSISWHSSCCCRGSSIPFCLAAAYVSFSQFFSSNIVRARCVVLRLERNPIRNPFGKHIHVRWYSCHFQGEMKIRAKLLWLNEYEYIGTNRFFPF